MAKFIIYIDADNITVEEQKKLNEDLMNLGYYTVISDSKDNKRYILPIYQYFYEGSNDELDVVVERVDNLVNKLTSRYEITAHEIVNSKYIGLKEYKV